MLLATWSGQTCFICVEVCTCTFSSYSLLKIITRKTAGLNSSCNEEHVIKHFLILIFSKQLWPIQSRRTASRGFERKIWRTLAVMLWHTYVLILNAKLTLNHLNMSWGWIGDIRNFERFDAAVNVICNFESAPFASKMCTADCVAFVFTRIQTEMVRLRHHVDSIESEWMIKCVRKC